MNDQDTRDLLTLALGPEPSYSPDIVTVLAQGGRLRRRRRVLTASSVAVGTCAVVAAAMVAAPALTRTASPAARTAVAGTGGDVSASSEAPRADSPAASVAQTAQAAAEARVKAARAAASAAIDARIAAAIRDSSPASWTLDLKNADSSSGGIDGTADDGQGKGQISVGISTGSQQIHPCSDPEFKSGLSCTERVLASGAVLSLRGLMVADNGAATYEVVITYPDGSGLNAEAGNYSLAELPTTRVTPQEKKALVAGMVKVHRDAPTYSLSQLQAVALAVDAAIH